MWTASRRGGVRAAYILPWRALSNVDMILVEDGAHGAIQGGAGLHPGTFRGHFGGFGLFQQALVLDHEEAGGGAHFELGLLGVQRFLLQPAASTAAS